MRRRTAGAARSGCAVQHDLEREAVGVGFEPTNGMNPLPVFKTGAFSRSATPPVCVYSPSYSLLAMPGEVLRETPQRLSYPS